MRPRLLDLFSCAGGAAAGYVAAGFDVLCVDLHPQPRNPFAFAQADATRLSVEFVRSFDAVHASPPCQFGTAMRHAPNTRKDHPNLIPATRQLLQAAGVPYVIENVEDVARAGHLIDPVCLCGTMFGLGVQGHELRRHRWFESNVEVSAPCACRHTGAPVVGVYGGHARRRSAAHGGRGTRDEWAEGGVAAARVALQMPWASGIELSEAIPPAYTRHLGAQLLESLGRRPAKAAAPIAARRTRSRPCAA